MKMTSAEVGGASSKQTATAYGPLLSDSKMAEASGSRNDAQTHIQLDAEQRTAQKLILVHGKQ